MIDTVFEDRLDRRDLLEHGPETILVETSAIAPPMNLWSVLDRILKAGYRPLIAHPERYRYMDQSDYRELHNIGCHLQLNLPSIVGFYGEAVRQRAQYLLDKGWYRMVGSDCHRFRAIEAQYTAKELKKDTIAKLSVLMDGSDDD
jgi:tyrosine-protein phosphatase YwqE